MKRFVVIFLAAIFAGCSSIQRTPWSPFLPCGEISSFADGGMYESAQVVFNSGGLKIGALLTKPKGSGPFPVYVHNHGAMTWRQAAGPLWAVPVEFDAKFAGAGYVILRMARRGYLGSEGTAKTYWVGRSRLAASDVIQGAYEEAQDVQAAVQFLEECPFVDRRRIAIGGHSVGGLVSVIAGAKHTGLAAVVSVNGGITWTQNGTQQGFPAVSAVWRAEAEHLTVPILLLHGQNDAVVTPQLSRELAELLEQRNAPVTLKMFPGDHSAFPVDEVIDFLDKTVKAR